MFRTVWSENPAVAWAEAVPGIGLAAHDATQPPCDRAVVPEANDADAGTTAAATAIAIPPPAAVSRLPDASHLMPARMYQNDPTVPSCQTDHDN
jgi:hypothetical protein